MSKRSFITLCLCMIVVPGMASSLSAHTDVTVEQAWDMIDSNDQLIVLDVREEIEYCDVGGHIPGSLNYPWNSEVLQETYTDFVLDAEILIVCRSGNRSNSAAEFLDGIGYLNVYDMMGGMLAWQGDTEACDDPWGTPASIMGENPPPSSAAANTLLVLVFSLGLVMFLKSGKR